MMLPWKLKRVSGVGPTVVMAVRQFGGVSAVQFQFQIRLEAQGARWLLPPAASGDASRTWSSKCPNMRDEASVLHVRL